MASNQIAVLDQKDSRLTVRSAPVPIVAADEIIVRNHAIAINHVDWHMQDAGVFVEEWPAVLGSDVAGEVFKAGTAVTRFQEEDRVPCDHFDHRKSAEGAFQLYTVVKESKAAIIPVSVSYTTAAALPLALETAVLGLCLQEPGVGVFGIPTPALGLSLPSLEMRSSGKTVIIYGASSSVGALAIRVAVAGGAKVIAIAAAKHFDLLKQAGANDIYDHNDATTPERIVKSMKAAGDGFVGIYDIISVPETYSFNLNLLSRLDGRTLASTHPPPFENVPQNVKLGMVLGVNDIATPVWSDYVTAALQSGALQCLPKQEIVGRGLASIQAALERSKKGVSATKLVVELQHMPILMPILLSIVQHVVVVEARK